ncbi:MAG: hypothetical protein U0869_07045 [Chloroflexota bacterium]
MVDRHGQLRGLLTIEAVMTWMRSERSRAVEGAAASADAADPAPVDGGSDDPEVGP